MQRDRKGTDSLRVESAGSMDPSMRFEQVSQWDVEEPRISFSRLATSRLTLKEQFSNETPYDLSPAR